MSKLTKKISIISFSFGFLLIQNLAIASLKLGYRALVIDTNEIVQVKEINSNGTALVVSEDDVLHQPKTLNQTELSPSTQFPKGLSTTREIWIISEKAYGFVSAVFENESAMVCSEVFGLLNDGGCKSMPLSSIKY